MNEVPIGSEVLIKKTGKKAVLIEIQHFPTTFKVKDEDDLDSICEKLKPELPFSRILSIPDRLNVKGNLISLDSPLVMGILNINPDSFFSESRTQTPDLIKAKAAKMLGDGASIIDIGGYSTRPGAAEVTQREETNRVILAVETILKDFPETVISVDTFRSAVAKAGIETGAAIINDVSGGLLDEEMFATVAKLRVPYILMHMRGTPQTMSNLTNYDNLLVDVCTELDAQLAKLKALGVADVVLDPGFGFAKTVEQNYEMLKNLSYFQGVHHV